MAASDDFFGKFLDYISAGVRQFAAFLFFWLALGMVIGMYLASAKPGIAIVTVIGVAAAGLIAYYSTAFALIVLALFFIIFFVL